MTHRQTDNILPNIRESEIDRWNALKKESTLSLIRRIAEDSDELALRVFHETRTLFYRNGKWVRLAEFIISLRDGIIREQGEDEDEDEDESGHIYMSNVTNETYDLTLAKFYNIPSKNYEELTSSDDKFNARGFTRGVDCRFYFKRLLERIYEELSEKPNASEIDIEGKVSKIATKFVIGEFNYSKQECKRRNIRSIRYSWQVKDRVIYLYYPPHFTAQQFRGWLEENVANIDPDNPYEINRIQEIIDQKFQHSIIVQGDDLENDGTQEGEEQGYIEQKEGNQFSSNLRIHVAKEKSENLESLRPAIKRIGKEGVYNLVNQIFTDMADEQYNLSEVARNFNLSKATLSRFAGSEWLKDMNQLSKADIPDLWINTARVLAGQPKFMEFVMNAGFKDITDKILKMIDPQEGPKND